MIDLSLVWLTPWSGADYVRLTGKSFSYELKIIVNTFFFLRSSRSNFFFSEGSRDDLEDLASRDEDFVDFVDCRELETESEEDNRELLISLSLDSSLEDGIEESFKMEDFVRLTISRALKSTIKELYQVERRAHES